MEYTGIADDKDKWVELPKGNGTLAPYGIPLRKSFLLKLAGEGEIWMISCKGAKSKGKRLVNLRSVVDFFERQPTGYKYRVS